MIQRSAWQNTLHLIEESKPPSPPPAVSQLPFLPAQTPSNMAWIQGASATAPHPPVRTRPASAGARRPGHHLERGVPSLRAGSWTGSAGGGGQSLRLGAPPQSPQTLEHLLQEKEERLLRLGDEVSRLLVFEAESKRKDTVIASLRDDISALKLRAAQARGDSEITQKLQALEREIMAKKEQIQELKEQIMDLQKGSSEVLKHSFKERDLQISNLKNQVEKLKRDHGMSTGLVTSLQRDLSTREQQSLRLVAEVDKLRKDVRHKDAQLGAMSAKFSKMRETKKHEEELLARENEVIVLKKSVEEMERRMAEMRAEQGRSASERETMNVTLAEKCQVRRPQLLNESKSMLCTIVYIDGCVFIVSLHKKVFSRRLPVEYGISSGIMEAAFFLLLQVQAELQQEAERLRHQLQEMSRQEQRTRVELEQALARLQRFRSRIIQAIYTAPGVPTPQDTLSDQQVTEQMSVIIEERDELKSRVQDLQGQLDGWTSEQDKTSADTEQLKRALQECQARVQEAPSVPSLQREIAALRDQNAPPSLSWVHALGLSMLSSLLSWQQEAARALQDAGTDVAASANVIRNAWSSQLLQSWCVFFSAAPRRAGQHREIGPVTTSFVGVSGSIRSLWQKHQDREGDIRTLQVRHEFLSNGLLTKLDVATAVCNRKAWKLSDCEAELEELRVSQDALIQARVDSLNQEHERTLQQQQKTTREVMEQQNQQLLQQLEEREQERDRLQQALSEQRSELGRVEDQCRHLTQSVPQKSVLRMEAKRQEVESLTGRQQELSRELQSAREREPFPNPSNLGDASSSSPMTYTGAPLSSGPVCSSEESRPQTVRPSRGIGNVETSLSSCVQDHMQVRSSVTPVFPPTLQADLQQEAQRQQACWPAKEWAAEERGARLERERQGVREAEYREQVHQHARTIVALEQRLARAAQSQRAGEEERAALEARLSDAEKRLESRSPGIPPAPPVPVLPQDVEALKQTCALLRAELAEAQREASAQRDTIAGLSRDLAGANAKMSDMAGELSEQQKLELEQHRALVAEQRAELSVLRQRLAQMSQLVEQKGQDLHRAEEELRLCKADLEMQVNVLRERELQSETLQEDKRASSPDPQHTATGGTQLAAAELADLGAKCKGHRHEEVIQRQREALAELRARIKALEQTRPQRSSQEQAVQQVALMRRELSELRAQQAVADSLGPLRAARELSQTSSAELPLTDQALEETLDRTARLDLSDALDLSERTYRDLVKALCGALELGELSGCASLKHLPPDERDRLGSRRQQDLELLHARLRVLHGQAQRKEELLSEYQADLRRLRESQAVGQQLQAELDRLRQELQSQTQESSLLREALERAQQRLEQEKSLNRAIKERKPLLKEQLERRSVKTPSHSCVQEDTHGTAAARKASLQGRLKKKEYEIETLKKQLRKQGQEMCTTSSQLANLQNALASSETR
ncbi:FHAD1 protein, partial [Atractosteus spatula]|nr:FHAD1 protein [Atractosteus spatula]